MRRPEPYLGRSYVLREAMDASAKGDIARAVLLFPALTQNPGRLKSALNPVQDGTTKPRAATGVRVSRGKRSALLHSRQRASSPVSDSSVTTYRPGFGSGPKIAHKATTRTAHGSKTNGTSFGGEWGCGDGSSSNAASSTSKKMMHSLSTSVYNDLQPFRKAHQQLIKNRMAAKSTDSERRAALRGGGAASSRKRRKRPPLDAGLEKITAVASSFAWMHSKVGVKGIQRRGLIPGEFKEQLQMALHIYLRPSEAAAITEFFDPDGTGRVNGEYFVRWFLHIGNKNREERLAKQAAERVEEQRKQQEEQRERRAAWDRENQAIVDVEFSESDAQEALAILANVARSYHDQRTGRDGARREFASALAPDDFREQLHLSFGLRLSDPQFSALFHIMDVNRDRYVDGAEFLHQFFGLGSKERAKEQMQQDVNCQVRARKLRLDKLPTLSPIMGR